MGGLPGAAEAFRCTAEGDRLVRHPALKREGGLPPGGAGDGGCLLEETTEAGRHLRPETIDHCVHQHRMPVYDSGMWRG